MNAVIYARYSSHNQTEQSIEGQLRDCYEYAKRNDLAIIGEYIDRAISGKTDERPDFQRMIKDASKRQFERILVWKLDRFARNRYDSATYKHKLKQYGVKVISAMENVGEGDESVLLEALLEASAEYYSLDLKKKIARGMRESALRGKFVGGTLPWWCRVDDEQKLTVIDERAAIVREAFIRYDSGEGSKSIVSDFAKRGLRSNRGVPVTLSWLLSILKNRKTIGEYTYNGIEIPGGLPAVVDKPLFDRVQDRIARNRRTGGGEARAKTEYLLQGKLFCGLCGSPVTAECGQNHKGVVYNYYACSLKKKKHQCKKANERKDFLEWYVVEQTLDYVLTPARTEYIASAIVAEYEREFDKSGIRVLEQKIALTEGEIQKTMDLCIQATTDAMRDRFMKRCEELDAKKADMEIDLSKLRVAASIVYTKDEVCAWLRQFCTGDCFDPAFRRRIIDVFINTVYLYDEKLIIYYNLRDSRQVSYIEAIGASSEIENLLPVPDNKKSAAECSTTDGDGGTRQTAYEPIIPACRVVKPVKSHSIFASRVVVSDFDAPVIVDKYRIDEGLHKPLLAIPVCHVHITEALEKILDVVARDANARCQLHFRDGCGQRGFLCVQLVHAVFCCRIEDTCLNCPHKVAYALLNVCKLRFKRSFFFYRLIYVLVVFPRLIDDILK